MYVFVVRLIACVAFGVAALGAIDASALALTGVKSRKVHGTAGTFDLPIDTTQALGASVTVEPRTIGNGHTIVFQFDGPIILTGTVLSMDGFGPIGSVSAAITGALNIPANNEVSVTLTGIPENKRVSISLTQVNGILDVPPVSMGFLVGDVNSTRTTNSSDISSVKARSGQSTTAASFMFDVNATGAINSSDISAVKARSGLTLSAANEVSLLVSKGGTGAGSVSSAPAGINCGFACAGNFTQNSSVTLTAAANTGSNFTNWSGACTGAALTSMFVLAASSTCNATFAINTYAVTPSAGPNGSISPLTVQTINHGSTATFTVTPNSGFIAVVGGSCGGSLLGTTYTTNAVTTACTIVASFSSAPTWYISTTGNNAGNGQTPATAWKTFAKAFSTMAAGDQLILLDGQYSTATTGIMHWDTSMYGVNSAQVPSGVSLTRMTIVRALNPGNVTINGPLFIGRSARKDSFILIQGVTFEGTGDLYNTSFNTIKDCGFHGTLSIGTNDHTNGNTDNLIEDVWVWAAEQRIIAITYRGDRNVWRRVVVRGDGCSTAACLAGGSPNVGITVYESHDVSLQNVIVVDRVLTQAVIDAGNAYSDFAIAEHTPPQYLFGRNEWLGTISIKAPDSGYVMEPDVGGALDPTIKISNAVAWDAVDSGFNLGRSGTNNLLENLTVNTRGGDGIRVAPELTTGTLRNVIVDGAGRYGFNSAYTPTYVDVFNAVAGAYNQSTCSTGCFTSDPRAVATPSLKYLTRIETSSPLKGAGFGGADIGANILFRYGVDGTRFGETNYNTLTTTPLWPWPNESRIKSQMCASTTRGFCSSAAPLGGAGNPALTTLTTYIWEYLGNPIPVGIYP